VKGFEDVGEQVGVGQGEISGQVANFGHILQNKLCKINGISLHNII